jgi:hypothetical protein
LSHSCSSTPFFLHVAIKEYIAAVISAAWWEPANKNDFRPRLCKALHKIGRKNFLFAGSHEGAQRAAVMFTFADQCKRLNIDPHRWLTNVFENILDTKPSQYYNLLPQKYPGGNS